MKTWFVSRHPGAVFWAAEYGIKVSDGGIVADLDVSRVKSGDTVIGTLPIQLAASVIRRGGRYVHLSMEVPASLRGKELSKEEMKTCRAKLESFDIHSLGRLTKRSSAVQESVMVAIASGQILQNMLPLLAMKPKPQHLYVLVSNSEDAIASASRIERFCRHRRIQVSLIQNMPDSPLDEIKRFVYEKCVAKILTRYPKANIVLNATGGTKMMSSGAAAVIERHGDVIYCDTANQRIEYLQREPQPAYALPPNTLSLDDYFSLQGLKVLDTKRASRNRDFQRQVATLESTTRKIVELLVGKAGREIQKSIPKLNYSVSKVLDEKRNGQVTWSPIQAIDPIDRRLIGILEAANIGVKFEAGKIFFPAEMSPASKAAVAYCKGDWLEHYCYLIMRDLGLDQKFWDCNIEIRPVDGGGSAENGAGDSSINEIDLAISWRNRILIVECKTGSQLRDKSLEITAKLHAIRNYAGGSMADAMVLSSNDLENGLARENALIRERLLGTALHTREALADLPRLITDWLGDGYAEASGDSISTSLPKPVETCASGVAQKETKTSPGKVKRR